MGIGTALSPGRGWRPDRHRGIGYPGLDRGHWAVIGASAVVIREVDPGAIAIGVPARSFGHA